MPRPARPRSSCMRPPAPPCRTRRGRCTGGGTDAARFACQGCGERARGRRRSPPDATLPRPPPPPLAGHPPRLQVSALKKIPQSPRADKPVRLPLPHAIYPTDGTAEVCLLVKDHKGEGHAAAKARVRQEGAAVGVAKVIGLSKLRTKYESHEAKRKLCASYDLFLADDRVLPSLPKLIGGQGGWGWVGWAGVVGWGGVGGGRVGGQ